jgi:hypothetical protein
MADGQNTGTPPAAGAPASGGGTTPIGSDGSGGAPNSTGKRLIAGKYETMEDAVEQGIFGMEKAFHATREDLAKVTRILEATLTQGNVDPRGGYAPVGTGGRPGYGSDYGRGQQDPDYIDPAQFIVNPNETFQRRERRMLERVAGVVQNVVGNAMTVQEFKRQNPDLIEHERLVSAFMNETDPTKDYGARLRDAAMLTKQYLAKVQGNTNPAPGGANFVEGPRGAGPGAGGGPSPGAGYQPAQDEEERELLEYISERNKDISARFGIKT